MSNTALPIDSATNDAPRSDEAASTHLGGTRERVASHVRGLADRVETATDWREHLRDRPHLALGMAFAGGVMVGAALRYASPSHGRDEDAPGPAFADDHGSIRSQAHDLWRTVQAALAGVASARVKDYISASVPGFDEHYRRAEERFAAVRSNAVPRGMAG
jgi:hypothetical protein